MRISLVTIEQTGAAPVYSLEMAKALLNSVECELQIIVSENVSNINKWNSAFEDDSNVDYHVIKTYKHTKLSVLLNNFNYIRQERLIRLVRDFKADILYLPFGLMWARYVYWRLHGEVKIVDTLHDVEFHDSFKNLSLAELGCYLLNYGSERYVDGTVILNNKDKKIVEKKTHKPVVVIPHAALTYYFDDTRRINYDIKGKIGFFGRIEVYKGLDILVDAYEKCHVDGLKLLIAGNGSIEISLVERITANPSIELINRYINDEEFQAMLDSVDFVVLPYKRASQSGVIPMCFAAGKTVIATNVGALQEQVPDGTGMVVLPESNEIAKAIYNMYADVENVKVFGQNAKRYAESILTWEHSAELLINFCKKL